MHSHFTNRPTDILSSWIVQEILSPQILRPEQYPAGGPAPILSLENGPLPWEREPEDPGPDRKFVYQVILDSIDLDKAIAALYQVYLSRPPAFSRSASTRAGKEAILAVVVLDDKGRMTGPSGGSGLTFSPFAWGLPRALTGDLRGIGGLREIDGLRGLTDWTSPDPHPQPARGYLQPLNKKDLDEVRDNLIRALGLPRELMTGHCFVIRTTVHAKARALPDPLLFNPSLIKDLKAVQTSFAEGRASHNLQLYLGHRRPHERTDILQDAARLKSSLAPRLMPPVRWPDPFGRPLLLLQQAAVNLAMRTLTEDGLLAVNGPPGTGKTTLLRDMMAAIIASRAEAMSAFADPAEAFSPSGHRIPAGGAWLHIFKLDARLKWFEILITSSKNKSVENIIAELPAIH
ncbi:MAG: hypothetical protein Q8938_08425, partial [Bacteroidota bacterium]|nr:hypothetical protein [Bacteroidota bacterium]